MRLIGIVLIVFSLCAQAKSKTLLSSTNSSETISVAAIDWCPQICPDKPKAGYVMDLVKRVFNNSGYKLEVTIYPWSRAIRMVRTGQADALLSPAKAEAPDLIYPAEPVGLQRMCFFTPKKSNWLFTDVESLKGMTVGLAADTSIEELNDYIKANPSQFQYQPYLSRYIKQSTGKLDKGRIDTFLFTYATTMYEMEQLGISENYRNAGCVSDADIYMAFTPQGDRERINTLQKLFTERMMQLHQEGVVKQVMANYQLPNWKQTSASY